jgi:type III secretion protein V
MRVGRAADVLLAVIVAGTVGMMVVPLPTPLLDVLISANLAIAVTLLAVTLYVRHPLKIASFPTILLLTTLYRLALNVSSTRLILLQADAGQVIRAFGGAVVRGNFVVGAIVFVILTIVQYVVIARGAERVAEVAARFTLDALPGKQMAIDADLRAGAIGQDEAQRRRAALARESQFYGAMDGAMKFVKGDAIAGILIAIVSIIGGLAIGAGQHGMSLVTALKTYGLLTIGDALVSQIPALLLSTAAGIVVTRVATSDEGSELGREIFAQVAEHPTAIATAAALLLGLAFVPGLPLVPFLTLAVVAGVGAILLYRRRPASEKPDSPILVEIGGELGAGASSTELAATIREAAQDGLGVRLPLPDVAVARELGARGWRLSLAGYPIGSGAVPAGSSAAIAMADVLRRHAHELVGIQETQDLLDGLERSHPALVREVVPRLVSAATLADVLSSLLREQVSIRDLRGILEALAAHEKTDDAGVLVEHVRAGLRRQLTFQYIGQHTKGESAIAAFTLDGAIEQAIGEAIVKNRYLALEPDLSKDIQRAIGEAVKAKPGAILTRPELRRWVKQLVEPEIVVLSYQDLLPEVKVQSLGTIAVR